MFSKQIISAARGRALLNANGATVVAMSRGWAVASVHAKRAALHSTGLLQSETVKVPQMAESITEGTLKSWLKQVGDSVAADEEIATIETDKIDVSVNAPTSGKIVELLAEEEDTVTVGQDLFRIEPGEAEAASQPTPKETEKSESPTAETSAPKETEKPAEKPVEKAPPKPSPQPAKQEPQKESSRPAAAATAPGSRNETRVKMNRMRLRIAERLKESQNAAASLTTFNEIDMSSLMDMRKRYKDAVLKEHEVKLGFMSAFAKACTLALKEIPVANASIEGEEIVYHDYVDLSVAARDGKLTLEDMAGGTFTISNGGVFGSLYGTPIINLPQSAVLGMHAIKDKPVVVDGQIVIRPIMIVALTYDHRLLDGREATTFLVKVKAYLEDPRKMLLA
ncbi:dihydrolipoamide succinyltransferase [Mycena galopus ATCC 62051]|nr:dihydrolipoamide succinyltransferase [Mycena galopus ATCC 62051]